MTSMRLWMVILMLTLAMYTYDPEMASHISLVLSSILKPRLECTKYQIISESLILCRNPEVIISGVELFYIEMTC